MNKTNQNDVDVALSIAKQHHERSIHELSHLIKIQSLTGEEADAQKYIADALQSIGARVDQKEPNIEALFKAFPHITQYPTHWQHDLTLPYTYLPNYKSLLNSNNGKITSYKNRPNVIGTLPGTSKGRSLILNGHVDTVTVEPRGTWSKNPFGAHIENGLMYGRGSSDMKGGLMAGLMALTYIQEANVRLHGDVIFQSVVNEEHSGNGTLDLVRQKYKADAAIVLEPTENRVCTEHPGGVYWEIKIPGIAKSPGARWRHGVCVGISAIEKLPLLVNSLLHLEEQLNHGSKSSSRDTVEAAFSMVIGKIKGGHYETATASELTVRGVAYFSPSVGKVESVMDKLKCAVEKCNQSDEFLTKYPAEIKFLHHDDSATQTSAIAIAQHAQRILNARENNTAITSGPFCCDMRHLVNRANIPTIIFGPGTIEQAHKPDENISIEQYLKSIEHLIELIITWSNCNIS